MHLIGHLGHAAILLPASLLLSAVLAANGRRNDALALLAALAICLTTTIVGKLAFHACGARVPELDIESPSGHTAFATMFYGCLALILGGGRPSWQAGVLLLAAAVLAILIGWSRYIAQVHTGPDVLVGLGIGAVSVGVFHFLRGKPRPVQLATRTVLLGLPLGLAAVALVLLAARHWTPEPLIQAAALRLDRWLDLCM